MAPSGRAVVQDIPYSKLIDPSADLTQEIIKGFGPEGLGIVTVSGVPQYEQLRERLLPLAQAFADLPDDVKAAHEDAGSKYNVGWSHGKEALRSGLMDTHKGSFYANPLQDTYDDVDPATAAAHRTYYSPNIWPREHLPALEGAFKELGGLIIGVGLKLAGHCSRYVQQQVANATGQPLSPEEAASLNFEGELAASSTHKARLLHYFPVDTQQQQQQQEQEQQQQQQQRQQQQQQQRQQQQQQRQQQQQQQRQQQQQQQRQQQQRADEEDWCGWHLDHGSLTGLTCAMYMRDGAAVPPPDPAAGLYICNRAGSVVQAAIPPGSIAYQMGQVMAIQSGGLLRATPHYVRAAGPAGGGGAPRTSRNTFAVFMQPALEAALAPPRGLEGLGGLLCLDSGHWEPGMTFGEFAEATLAGYYQQPRPLGGSDDGDDDDAGDGGSADAHAGSQDQRGTGRSPGKQQRGARRGAAAAAADKDVAPAAVHMAVAATGRHMAQLIVSHE